MQIVPQPDFILVGGLIPQMWLDNTSLKSQLNQALLASPIARLLSQRRVDYSIISLSGDSPINFHLPHEELMSRWQGYSNASEWLANQDLNNEEQHAFANNWRVLPVHCRLATDHISLANIALDGLSLLDAKNFVTCLDAMTAEYGARLEVSERGHWFLSWPQLQFNEVLPSSPCAALGRSIDAYLPRDAQKGNQARLWRRFVTECEMAWFNHPDNNTRLMNRLLPLNSLWLVGRVNAQNYSAKAPSNAAMNSLGSSALNAIMSDQPFEWSVAIKELNTNIFDSIAQKLDSHQKQTILLTNDQDAQLLTLTKKKFWQQGLAFTVDSLGLQGSKKS